MSHDDPYDDEEWYEDEDEPDEEEAARCPECGEPVHIVTDKCPNCGYWLAAADRRALRFGESKPHWVRITSILVLTAIIVALMVAGVAFF